MRRILHGHCGISFLVVVGQIDIKGVALPEAENDPPVPRDRDALQALEVALQRVEPPAGKQAYVARFLGRIERGEHVRDLLGLAGGNATAVVVFEQALEPFVSEAPDGHFLSV
jgi:hypothetical protein